MGDRGSFANAGRNRGLGVEIHRHSKSFLFYPFNGHIPVCGFHLEIFGGLALIWDRNILSFRRLGFPLAVLGFYLLLSLLTPEKTLLALKNSRDIFIQILLPLGLVFLLMTGLNLFLRPSRVTNYLGRGTIIKQTLLAVISGIISTGPIYAWYPMLKELREKGVRPSLLAVFLVNRAVKPLLLPVMVSFFGWVYVVSLTVLIISGSLGVGLIIGSVLDFPEEAGGNASDYF
jgi:uncharacterized membrane protein YraQ (UPF0718 family)